MNAKTITTTLSLLTLALGGFTAAGCAVSAEDPAPEDTRGSSAPLMSSSGGAGGESYSCSISGKCECYGYEDCDDMLRVCQSNIDCWHDWTGYHCTCSNVPLVEGSGSSGSISRIGGNPVLEK